MRDKIEQVRMGAVQRFSSGEKTEAICASLGQSKSWLCKWVARHAEDNDAWNEDLCRRPIHNPSHTSTEIEEIVRWFVSTCTTIICFVEHKPSIGRCKISESIQFLL